MDDLVYSNVIIYFFIVIKDDHMSEIEISVAESKKEFTKLIRDSADKNDSFIITKSGKPAAVIVSFEDYQKLKSMAGYAELIKLRNKLSKSEISAQQVFEKSKSVLEKGE